MGSAEQDASQTRLRNLQVISDAALAHLEFAELVPELLNRLTALLGADTAAVLLRDEERDELVARAAKGLEEEVEAEVRVPIGRGFAGRIAAQGRPVFIPDLATADVVNPILREKGLVSMLGAPLLVQGQVIGVVHVGSLTRRDFTDDDAALLQAAADRIALAIDHSRMYAEAVAARAAAERNSEQLRRLESVTEAALAHLALDELLGQLLARIRELVASDTVVVLLVDAERDELVTKATLGVPGDTPAQPRMRIGEGVSGRVAETGRSVAVEDVSGVSGGTVVDGLRSVVGVPLIVGGRVTGVLVLGNFEQRSFSAADVDLLERVGDRIALAIENARLYEAERLAREASDRAAEQIRRIESITEVALHHISLDEEVLEGLLERVREALGADVSGLLVLDDMTQTVVAGQPDGPPEVERRLRLEAGAGFAGRVAELREPLTVVDSQEVQPFSPLLRASGVRSLAGVPLVIEERLLGVLHVGSRVPREFDADDVALLTLAGERLAVAIDHARLYEREHFVAETLQRSLLPERLPELSGVSVASRYLPGEGEAVGGDWYDVVQLRDGRVALVMGDVVSRGVRAAAVMGQLRNALRAYALEGHAPSAVLDRLHGITRTMEGRELATLVHAVLEPSTGEIVYATAGHPPPIVVATEAEPTLLEEGRGPPLGAIADPVFPEALARLEPGDTLLLYTDGIVERRDMWIDEGLERLVAEASSGAGLDPDALLDRLTAALLGDEAGDDDVALLALRLDVAPGGLLRLTLDADPTVLSGMRQALRDWLATAGATPDDSYDVLVAATEAAANAVEHAYGPGDATFEIEARSLGEGQIALTVRDRGAWRPPRGHNRGRGTLLMQELMDEFEVTTGEAGTEVKMSKRLARELVA